MNRREKRLLRKAMTSAPDYVLECGCGVHEVSPGVRLRSPMCQRHENSALARSGMWADQVRALPRDVRVFPLVDKEWRE